MLVRAAQGCWKQGAWWLLKLPETVCLFWVLLLGGLACCYSLPVFFFFFSSSASRTFCLRELWR